MTKIEKFDASGKIIEDDDHVLRDGERIRVRVSMMDTASVDVAEIARRAFVDVTGVPMHRPGYAQVIDADQEKAADAAWDRKVKLTGDAWKHPPAIAIKKDAAVIPLVADSEAAAQRRDARLEQAWKGAV